MSASRVAIAGGFVLLACAAIFHWAGLNGHVSPLAMEWSEVSMEVLGPAVLILGAVRYVRGRSAADRLAARLVVLAVALPPLVVAGEFATRLVLRNVTTTSDIRSYLSRRWFSSRAIRENHLGFRGREFAIPKPPHLYRIAVIGDSFTYGNGAAEEDRLTNLLDRDCAGRGCEVLNFGAPGAATSDNIATLRNAVLPIQPDFVLLAWFVNDPEETTPPDRPPHFRPLLPWPAIEDDLYRRSALFTLLKINWANLQLRSMHPDPYAEYMRKRFEDVNGSDAREADAEIRTFIHTCKDHHVGVGIVLWPHLGFDLRRSYPFDFLHQHVLGTCADEAIPCVDLRPALAAEKDRRKLFASRFDTHPGLKANQLAEHAVLETFGSLWLHSG